MHIVVIMSSFRCFPIVTYRVNGIFTTTKIIQTSMNHARKKRNDYYPDNAVLDLV